LIFAYFAAFLDRLSPHCQPLFYFFIFYFWEKNEFWGITQNWVMTTISSLPLTELESDQSNIKSKPLSVNDVSITELYPR